MAKITLAAACTLFIFFSFVCCLPPTAVPLSFDYPSFGPEDQKAIEIEGSASFSVGHIDISANKVDDIRKSQGRASYSAQPMLLWDEHTGEVASFTTSFSFIIKSKFNSNRGAGMAFFLASYPSSLPTGSAGYYNLCLTNRTGGAVALVDNRFVAVEFDTAIETEVSDPNSDHVGIDVNSLISVVTLPLPNLTLTGNMTAAIQYDNITSIMSLILWLGDGRDSNYSLSSKVDLKSALPELVDVGFSASTGKSVELHQLLSWHFNSSLEGKRAPVVAPPVLPPSSSRSSSSGIIAGAPAGASLFLVVFLAMSAFFVRHRRNKKKKESKDEDMDSEGEVIMEMEFGTGPRRFPYRQLNNATRNFAAEEKLGQGGFGAVYRGHLRELGLAVAIKRFSKESSMQGRKEYKSEINVISRLRHRNLVQLVGWCHNHDELLLVYELMPNRSLDIHLHGNGTFLTWAMRMKIMLELGSALLYLHEEWEQCGVHRDIKPGNVMLDESFGAKLGDFGLARLIDHAVGMQTMTIVWGTPGYVDPQCLITGRASSESDVYSFGVVLLEVACGRRPMSTGGDSKGGVFRLTEWVWELYGQGRVVEGVDELLKKQCDEAEVERVMAVGLWCAHPDPSARPSIGTAMATLRSKDARLLPLLPARMPVPTYAPPMSPWDGQSSSSTGLSSSTVTRSSTTSGYTGPAPVVAPRA